MTVEKVLLTQEQADRLKVLKDNNKKLEGILSVRMNGGFITKANNCLNTLSVEDITTAFLVGYETKVTPEDRIKEFYEEYTKSFDDISYSKGITTAIRVVLDILGKEIEGVNK